MDDVLIRHRHRFSDAIDVLSEDDDVLDEGSPICEYTDIANAPRRSEALDATNEQESLQNSKSILQLQVKHQARQVA